MNLKKLFSLLFVITIQFFIGTVHRVGAANQQITLDGTGTGRIFDGVGAVSSNGTSRLLIDYPEPYRSQVLDYLFKPNYGASLQSLKVEIGGDVYSGVSGEPSHMRTASDQNYNRGYEWWLMQQAKLRNPNITLEALEWGAPGWIGSGNFYSQDNINYIVNFINGAKNTYNLTIDYAGVWNEAISHSTTWIKNLKAALVANGLGTKLIAADQCCGDQWNIIPEMNADSALKSAIDAVGVHYPTYTSPASAKTIGKPIWSTEDGPWRSDWVGAGSLAKTYNHNYIDGKMTKTEIWNLVTSYYNILRFPGAGLMFADTPWSGNYNVKTPIWATAHTTQFAQPGWQYVDNSSGYLTSGGTFATLKNGTDFSTIIETIDAGVSQPVTFNIVNGLSSAVVHVWKSDSVTQFVQQADIIPVNGSFSITLSPGSIYSLTTTSGQAKGNATSAAAAAFPFPYTEDFDSYSVGQTPKYISDSSGAYEVVNCAAGRAGNCFRQQVNVHPIDWRFSGPAEPATFVGGSNWSNYQVSIDFLLEQAGNAKLMGRLNSENAGNGVNAYELYVDNAGNWSLRQGNNTVLMSGTVPMSLNTWHSMKIVMSGTQIQAVIDGVGLGTVSNATYATGMAGFGVKTFTNAQFDNLRIETPVFVPSPPTITGMNPTSTAVGNGAFTLNVTGTNFTSSSTVRWNNSDRSTTYVSSVLLTATIPASDIAATGTANVTVFDPFNGTSSASTFTVVTGTSPSPTPWWDSSYAFSNPVSITASTDALPAGYSLGFIFDHQSLVNTGKSLVTGEDVRVLYWNGTAYTQLDRVLDLASSWNSSTTKLWFKTLAPIPANTTSTAYYVYYGNPVAVNAPKDPNNVWTVWDDFESSSLDTTKWTVIAPGTGVTVTQTGGQLRVTGTTNSANQYNVFGISSVATSAANFAADADFSIVAQSASAQANWKGIWGYGLYVKSIGSSDKRVQYWNGSWVDLGDSSLDATTFTNKKIIENLASTGDAQYFEGGVLKATRVGVDTTAPKSTTFAYGPDVGGGNGPFDVRFDNIRVRKYVKSDRSVVVQLLPPTQPISPFISNVAASSVTTSTALIIWTTNNPATSQVGYGLDTTYASTTLLDSSLVTSHSQTLIGLAPGTLYHYRVSSQDASGSIAFSGDGTFVTIVTILTGISPTSTVAGSSAFTLNVTGNNFTAGSIVRWNGGDRPTTFVNNTSLTVAIPASDVAAAGTANVLVFDPTNGTSGTNIFTVSSAPAPVLTSISPTSTVAGSSAFTLNVAGSNFTPSSTVRWNGTDRPTTYVSATSLTAAIPALDVAATGTASIVVFDPNGTSGNTTFTVVASPPANSATFVQTDITTQGSWKGKYGSVGYNIVADSANFPASITVAPLNQLQWTWASSTSDMRALQKAIGTDRIAATWYSGTSFTIDLNSTDGLTHQIALYLVDWDHRGRAETITFRDAVTNALLDTQSASSFDNGRYLLWNVKGHVTIVVTKTLGDNAVISGVFVNN